MPIFNSIIAWIMKNRIHQIELFIKYPIDVQVDLLRKHLNSAKDTEWGIKYDFASIKNWEEFKNRVPLQDYESLKPSIERIRRGEQNILWHTDIKWFAKSSGTTSDKSKFIPVSQEALEECHFKGGKDLISIYCNNNPDTQIFSGKNLTLGGSHQVCDMNTDAYYGDVSAILMQNLPFWAELVRVPNLSIALMDEWEQKIEEISKATIDQNITNIAGVPSWTLILLRNILIKAGKSDISEIWPNLELYLHGGVNFTPYHEQFKQIISSGKMNYIETYNASEGFFGIQDRLVADDMLLMLDYGIFYEFIPMEHFHELNDQTISLEDVRIGQNYAMVISTNAGLWRYQIGDMIEFTSLSPYRIRITGRTKSFINAFGEELIVDNAEKAISKACEKSGAVVKDYTAAPIYFSDTDGGSHQWAIEFEVAPNDEEYFMELLDNALKALNSDYEAKRYHSIALKTPVLTSLPTGTFYKWLKSKGKLGGQHKVPRLSNNRKLIDEILSLI
ncbi:MAG: GH3 auxin-responsive promoter family protein [Bacteroidota bacterium]